MFSFLKKLFASQSNTDRRELVNAIAKLFNDTDQGKLDDLPCPECGQPKVSAWFTNPGKNMYRVWLMCEQCDFESRAQCSGRPKHFSEKRVHQVKQLYDEKITANPKFPYPEEDD